MKPKEFFKGTPYKLVDLIVWIFLASLAAVLVFKTGATISLWNSSGLLFLFILVAIALSLWVFYTVVEKDRENNKLSSFIRKDYSEENNSEDSNR